MGEGRKGGRRGRGEGSVALALLLDLARRSLRMLFVFFYFSIFLADQDGDISSRFIGDIN